MTRPTFEEINMDLAWLLSRRSTCSRLQVGCVIVSVDYRKIISLGYNGGAAGQDNECESLEPGQCGHLHAEENAIINCDAPRGTGKLVFCTDLPCAMCAKRFVNLGNVVTLFYERDYRKKEGLEVLARAGIKYVKTPTRERFDSSKLTKFELPVAPGQETAGCVACDTCTGFRSVGRPCAFCSARQESLVAAVSHLKRDPRDKFVRVGAFHGGHDDTRYVTFEPWDAQEAKQGNGEPRPPYAVRIASGG